MSDAQQKQPMLKADKASHSFLTLQAALDLLVRQAVAVAVAVADFFKCWGFHCVTPGSSVLCCPQRQSNNGE
jgi:hypothetical protein